MEAAVVVAGILGIAVILSVSIYVFARVRIEQERTLQKLIERGVSGDALYQSAGLGARKGGDLRRGLLLIGAGVSWSVVTFFVGGTAWMAGCIPLIIGLVFVLFWLLDGRPR